MKQRTVIVRAHWAPDGSLAFDGEPLKVEAGDYLEVWVDKREGYPPPFTVSMDPSEI